MSDLRTILAEEGLIKVGRVTLKEVDAAVRPSWGPPLIPSLGKTWRVGSVFQMETPLWGGV